MFELKSFLQEADTVVSKVGDLSIIPMAMNPDGKANLSSKTLDSGVMFSVLSKDDYDYAEFAFRDWSIVSNILSSFRNVETFNVSLETKEENGIDYPTKMVFSSDVVSVNHFLQRYPAIEKSPMIYKQYKERKINIKLPAIQQLPITENVYNELSRITGIINKKYFHIEKFDGSYYYCFGDMGSKSIDFAKVFLGDDTTYTFETGKYFPIGVVLAVIKALNFKCKIGIYKGYLFMQGETEHTDIFLSMQGRVSD
jgi:hypothetical protein